MQVCTIGGYEEVGKNMTAVKVDDDVFIFDIGLYIPGIVELQEEPLKEYTVKRLRNAGAIPDDTILDRLGWTNKVRAIFISHAHLDHVGGVPHLVYRYPKATIYATPFTMEVLKEIFEDEKIRIKNKLQVVQPDSTYTIKGKSANYKVDFVHTTHSTIHCVFPALHTREGVFFYALDLKFDNFPTLGKPPSYNLFKKIAKEKVKLLIVDSLYSNTEKRPGGEIIAKHMLEEAFSKLKGRNSAFFITTFSSHIERLNNIVHFAQKTGRQIIFLGRSLSKYVEAASRANACPFKNKVKLLKYRRQVDAFLKKLDKERGKYFIVCTGHQAEENSILDRIAKGKTGFNFREGDNLIFSSSIIPVPINILAREKMDKKLRKIGVKIQTDVHVHGHGSREDLREIIELLKPQHILPAHGSLQQETPMIELSSEYGYKFGETSHLSSDGKLLTL